LKVVIVGAGEVGFHVASRLSHENKDVVVIDKDGDAIRRISRDTSCRNKQRRNKSGGMPGGKYHFAIYKKTGAHTKCRF